MIKNVSATVLYGSQNNIQSDVTVWLNACFNVELFDHVAAHDTYRAFAESSNGSLAILQQRVTQSVADNCSDVVVVVGHHGDEYASLDSSFAHVQEAMTAVAEWKVDASVIGLWVNEFGTIDMLMHHNSEKTHQPEALAETVVEQGVNQHFGAAHLDTLTAAAIYGNLVQSSAEPMRKAA